MPETTADAVAQTKADPNRSMRESALVAEIERQRRWLVYIEGRFGDGSESAYKALRGEPLPEEFEG